jgi:hypothetical protein
MKFIHVVRLAWSPRILPKRLRAGMKAHALAAGQHHARHVSQHCSKQDADGVSPPAEVRTDLIGDRRRVFFEREVACVE